jgi:hypothetical protein
MSIAEIKRLRLLSLIIPLALRMRSKLSECQLHIKSVSKAARSTELPEFRDYMQYKYPYIDEDLTTMIEDLIARARQLKVKLPD